MNQKIVTRFAPSPTGNLHIGGARTALFAYLFAKHNGGDFLLRIEDTDKVRSTKEFEKNILDGMEWLSLDYDNRSKLIRQSERLDVYKKYIEKLIAEGKAFISKEKPEKEGDREEVIRFKNPNKKIKFNDLIKGEIEFDTTELGDFIIAKSLNEPIFHLTNVIDDIEMGITHIIRGEDHISNTPRQILIWEAIGAPRALYGHIPLILAPDRSKLSKRHGAVSVIEYKERGYLSKALVNFLVLLGWNPGDNREVMDMNEIIRSFDINKVQKGGAIFNEEKLKWMNKEYLKKMSSDEFDQNLEKYIPQDVKSKIIESGTDIKKIMSIIRDRIFIFSEVSELFKNNEFDFIYSEPEFLKEKLLWKGENDLNKTKERLQKTLEIIEDIPKNDFEKDKIKEALWTYAEKEGKGSVLWPLRFALSGKEKSPDPFTLADLIGKEKTINRIKKALEMI